MEVDLSHAVRLISPRVTALITTVDKNGRVNAAPYSWIIPVSFQPPMICLMIGGKHKNTYKNIVETGEFVVNIVSEDFGQHAIECEKTHSLEAVNLETVPSKAVKPPRVKQSRAILECKLKRFFEPEGSDHIIVMGEVVAAESMGDLDDIRPLLHDSGEKFRTIGKEIILKRK
jgi:flavin reductase (DIM6/NTAB) family NADH-FMN oxidoreductase RutF